MGAGTFTVMCSDNSGCPPVFSTVTVTAYNNPITADAGLDDTLCIQSPLATLNGSVLGASGGVWSGGNGTYSPNNTTLVGMNYSPTATELAAGFVDLILTTTGNDAIIDWVFLELRSTHNEVVATRAALVQADGDLMEIDGSNEIKFNTLSGNYYVTGRHRNH